MRKSDFLKQVQIELDVIKNNATKEEISKLDSAVFNHLYFDQCIYGQMTGSCHSDRAKELYGKVYQYATSDNPIGSPLPTYLKFTSHDLTKGKNYTPLEKYLFMSAKREENCRKFYDPSLKHTQIINYLKGKINSIKL